MCLALMIDLAVAGGAADLGCGVGTLAIAAAKLGWGPVDGYDHEVESVRATVETAAANGVAVGAHRWDLRDDPIPHAPTVTANLLRPLLLTLAARMRSDGAGAAGRETDATPDVLIASGLLAEEADEVAVAFPGLVEADRRVADGWAALLLLRA
jgi:ribosomal protein L11 methyltransferase